MDVKPDQAKAGKQPDRKQADIRRRDPDRTRRAILDAARAEFCQHGFNGARVERISRRSKSNMRMIYHYFGNKEGVYLSVLESAYSDIRSQELQLDLAHSAPLEGMRRLILFSFDFFATRSDFIALINTENILKGRFLKRLPSIQAMSVPLIDAIRDLLGRGEKEGVFRTGIDPLQFYVSIVAQSQLHISNRYTLSVLFNQDLTDQDWLKTRREHTTEMLLAYLAKPD
ncbi:MAG: TetR/AcrR family transcriptional regulator [Albidovulum sp.]